MINQEEKDLLAFGVETWNRWRENNLGRRPDLRGANLDCTNLSGVDLRGANLRSANLKWTNLRKANLRGANLSYANLSWSTLSGADLSCANLVGADLMGANFSVANLSAVNLREADLQGANLWCAQMSNSNLQKANLGSCLIYGISAWNLKLEGANQSNLIITPPNEMTITVDNLEVAQFLGLLLQNQNLGNFIHSINSKIVLILGNFQGEERQEVINQIRNAVRDRDYLPVVFDFNKPSSYNLTRKIFRVAHMAQFIIADFTNPNTMPAELQKILPQLHSVPIQPIIDNSAKMELTWLENFQEYPLVLKLYSYDRSHPSSAYIQDNVITPAAELAQENICCSS